MERKKVLVISYYWPPAGGGGVQRWLKFVKYLPLYNITPVVCLPEGADYPVQDESLLKDVSPELETIKIPIWEPYMLFKLLTGKKKTAKVNTGLLSQDKKKSFVEKLALWLRGNILIPDPRVFWVRPAYRKLSKYLSENDIGTIITTGPPHSVHLIGAKLKTKNNIKWIADFRDPWSEIDYLDEFSLTRFARKKQQKLEHKVLTTADTVLTVSQNWAKDLKRLGAKKVEVITNGYDEDDFKDFNYNRHTEKFTLLYSGFISNYRNPKFLWETLEELCKNDASFADKFELKLFGTIEPGVIESIESNTFLRGKYYYGGYISHNELLKEYETASVLLLLQNNTRNAAGHIPGKVFEYLATGKQILAIGDRNSDIGMIIQSVNLGEVFAKNQSLELKSFLSQQLISNNPNQDFSKKKYSRIWLTERLAIQFLN